MLDQNQPDEYGDKITILDNGITVATRAVDPSKYQPNRCIYAVTVKAGAMHERPTCKGMAHFVEHLMFGEEIKKTWSEYLRQNGYHGTKPNASTSDSATSYSIRGFDGTPIAKVDFIQAFELQLRNIVSLDFSSETVERERSRILTEIRGRTHSEPARRNLEFRHRMQPGYLPDDIAGSEDSVASVTRRELKDFHDEMYVGSNILVAACFPKGENSSNINHESVVRQVVDVLGEIPIGVAAKRPKDAAFVQHESRFPVMLGASEKEVYFSLHFPGKSPYDPLAYPRYKLHNIFWDKFYDGAHKHGLLYYAGGADDENSHARSFGMWFNPPKENSNAVLELAANILKDIAGKDIAEDLELSKLSAEKDYSINELKTDTAFDTLHMGLLLSGKPQSPTHGLEASRNVSVEALQQIAREAIHGPISMRVDGDVDGLYVPSLESFIEKLRTGVPLPNRTLSEVLANRQTLPSIMRPSA